MSNIFIGFIFIFFNFTLNLGGAKIGLIPDFIGYIMISRGLLELNQESPMFMKVKPYATGMAVYTGVLYALDLLGITALGGGLGILLGIIALIISLYITYMIIMGILEMEKVYNTNLNGNTLKGIWTLRAVFSVLIYTSFFFPIGVAIFAVLSFIIAIYFLVIFNQSKNLYYGMKNRY